MHESTEHPNVREIERAFLRKAWWAFPVFGALASLAVGGPFWAWVDGQPLAIQWSGLLSLRTGLWALAFVALPAVWSLGLRVRRPGLWAAAGVLAAVAGAECVLRAPVAQTALWLAARARLGADQHFMREVCYVRLDEAAGRADPAPAVVLVGSSQVLHGVDDGWLRELLAPRPVFRRATFGLTPLKALAMRAYMPFRPGDVCVQYLSEFDFTNQEEFPFDWFRPYASWTTLPEVMRCVPKAVWIRRWRQVADYALAATAESWRARDFLHAIAFHFLGRNAGPAAEAAPADLAAVAAKARGSLKFSETEWNAFRRFAGKAQAEQVRLVVFEGDVNPAIGSADRARAKAETRRRISEFLAAENFRYVSLAEQGLDLEPGDWLDMTHLNEQGRAKLTRRIARELGTP